MDELVNNYPPLEVKSARPRKCAACQIEFEPGTPKTGTADLQFHIGCWAKVEREADNER